MTTELYGDGELVVTCGRVGPFERDMLKKYDPPGGFEVNIVDHPQYFIDPTGPDDLFAAAFIGSGRLDSDGLLEPGVVWLSWRKKSGQ